MARNGSGLRNWLPIAMVTALSLTAVTDLYAAEHRFSVLLDTDNNAVTGCTVPSSNGPVPGVDVVSTTVVSTSTTAVTVARLERQVCAAGILSAPVTYDAGGWNVGLGNGTSGTAVIESSIPLASLPAGGTMKAVVTANNATGGQDATAAFFIALAAPPPGSGTVTPVPLSPWLVLPLSLLLMAVTFWWRRRYPGQSGLMLLVVFLAVSGLVWAATVVRDGAIGDWGGVGPAVTDATSDAPLDADIAAVFYQKDGSNLFFRIDADVRKDSAANQAPVVSAGANQTISLPNFALLIGTATDDGLPNPPAVLTFGWAKISGPGTVTFAAPSSLTTTATFGVAGVYVLSFTANDSALATSASVTITVNPAGPGNQPPAVNAGADQSITLPATATLNGTATDDGLPNPPAALTIGWTMVTGPAPVTFANAAVAVTTAYFVQAGIYTLRLSASDSLLSVSSDTVVTVNAVAPAGPQFLPIPDQTIPLGARFQQVLAANSGNAGPLTYALIATPSGATLNPSPLVDWTPTAAQLGSNTFTVKVTDSGGLTATATFHVTVVFVNHPPQLGPQPDASLLVGASFSRTLSATDPDVGDTLTFALVSGPPGLTLSGSAMNWSTTGVAPGPHSVTVKVTDAGGQSDTRTFVIMLAPTSPPVANDDSYQTRLGQSLSVSAPGVLDNDVDPNARPLSAAKLSNPDKGTLTAFNADGSFNYQAPPTLPVPVFTPVVRYSTDETAAQSHQPLVIDVDGDGVPEIIGNSNVPGGNGLKAFHVKNGTIEVLWDRGDVSVFAETVDCTNFYSSGEPMRFAAGDIDDSGQISIVFAVACKRDIPLVPSFTVARYMAVNARDGTFKWLSPSLGGTRPEPIWGGTSEDGVALNTVPAITRMHVGESPSIVFAGEYANDQWGPLKRCERFSPGFVGSYCRAAIILDGRDGTIRQTMAALATDSIFPPTVGTTSTQPAAVVADLEGTGNMNIVFGATVWNADGSVKWNLSDSHITNPNTHVYTFWNGLGNFDETPDIEIVRLDKTPSTGPGPVRLAVFKADGRMLWSTTLSGDPLTGIPTIADVDGSGRPSVILFDSQRVCAIDYRGSYKWCHDEGNSPLFVTPYLQTGNRVAVYDLDGDGIPEVIVPLFGERLLFLDGATGAVKFDYDMAAGRPPFQAYPYLRGPFLVGSPIVADFENNGHASILSAWVGAIGRLDIIASQNDDWRPARKIFNQTTYHVGNVNDNGSIPQTFVNNFATPATNVFGTQAQVLTPVDPRLKSQTSFTYTAGNGTQTSQPAKVTIDILPQNRPPRFVSVPPTRWNGVRFSTFDYIAHAVDPDVGDTTAYSILLAIGGGASNCTIGSATGAFHCAVMDSGDYGFVIVATDSQGDKAYQTISLTPAAGSATVPNVVGLLQSAAATTITGAGFAVGDVTQVFNSAPVGRVLSQSPSAGLSALLGELVALSVSQGPSPVAVPFVVGKQLTSANAQLVGLGFTVTVTLVPSATIPVGEVLTQSPVAGTILSPTPANPVALTVSSGTPPTQVNLASIKVKPATAARIVGESAPFTATGIYNNGTSADFTLNVTWASSVPSVASVDVNGVAHAVAPGLTTISATIGAFSGSATLTSTARAPGDNTLPLAAITQPVNGATVTGITQVIGTATDANFLRYELSLAASDDTNFTLIGQGTTQVTNGVLGSLDPTLLLNGAYTLQLTVFDANGNSSVAQVPLVFDGNQKVGNFTLSYNDLTIPLAGIPIQISRMYDSRDKQSGDFGVGWSLGLKALRVSSGGVQGIGWRVDKVGQNFLLVPGRDHFVSVTLPSGKVESFDLQMTPTSSFLVPFVTLQATFVPRAGTLGSIQTLDNINILVVDPQPGPVTLLDDTTLDAFNPDRFLYRQTDGTQFIVTRTHGVESVKDLNGNEITISAGGISHSTGASVAFSRDANGRVTGITDPKGQTQNYAYTLSGDLASHSDATGGTSRYFYNAVHGLTKVEDPLNQAATRTEYDDLGRLLSITDAAGSVVKFAHDLPGRQEQVEDARGHITLYNYDDRGNVLAITDALGQTTLSTYDGLDNETSRIDSDGRKSVTTYSGILPLSVTVDPGGLNLTTANTFNGQNDPISVTDPAGRVFSIAYDANRNVTQISTPFAGSVSAVLSSQGLPLSATDALGIKRVSTRDVQGNVTREEVFDATSALLRRMEFTYDANGKKLTETLYRTISGVLTPVTTTYGYDTAGRNTTVTDAAGGITSIEYDVLGRQTALVDSPGRRTTFGYDVAGHRIRTTFADGTSKGFGYDTAGNIISETDQAGRTTLHTYDVLNQRVQTTLPDGAVRQTIYLSGGRIGATIDAKGNRTDHAYDTVGRRTATTLPAVANGAGGPMVRPQVSTAFDALGAPTTIVDPNARQTTFQYDALGRLTQTTFADGSFVRQGFDALGRRTSATNEEGQTTSFAFDGLGRVVSVFGLAGSATYTYDEAGNRLTQSDALGRTTTFRYDLLNRLVKRVYPGGETEQFVYDSASNVVATIDPKGQTSALTYDSLNRLTRKDYPDGSNVKYTYAPDGQRATVTDARGTTRYSFDARGGLSAVLHPGGETVSYTRDANGNLATLATPAALVNYGYDALDRLAQASGPEGSSQYHYDLYGNRVRLVAPTGVRTDSIYDSRNRPTLVTHTTSAGNKLQSFANAYSPASRRTQVTELDGSHETYAYDANGRLVAETRTGAAPHAITHSYDTVGNRIQRVNGGTPTTYSYDLDDRLLSDGTANYTHDANGNLTAKTGGAANTSYGYDSENRLVTIVDPAGVTRYSYDADGNRVAAIAPGGTTRYLVDNQNNSGLSQVLEERDGNGTLQARYTYGR
ncbi:MAG: PASTA domain-containing protein, partial [Betaproteobacteria bacterium]